MGTRVKKAIWFQTGKHEYYVMPPGWKPAHGYMVFTERQQMLDFARAAGLVLKDGNRRREYA